MFEGGRKEGGIFNHLTYSIYKEVYHFVAGLIASQNRALNRAKEPNKAYTRSMGAKLLCVQEVVTLQKKIFNIFASENEVYTIY